MTQLDRHIEILLLENECVIVPDFGGFIAHRVAARYDAADHSYLPPMRTLGFNPQLRMNDSVLAQSYVEAYDISYPEALRRIEDEVAEVKQTLSEEGTYVLNDVGTLTVNGEGNYEFTPCEAGILDPELYALGAFDFKPLKEELLPVAKPEEQETEQEKAEVIALEEPAEQPTLLEFTGTDEEHDKTVSIRMSWIRNTIAIAAAIAAFFLMSTPVVNSDLGNRTMSQLQSSLLNKLVPRDTNVVPAEPIETDITSETSKTSDTSKTSTPAQAAPAKPYCIVVASQVKRSNAEYFVEQLHKEGHPEAQVYIYNNVVRVICGEFETEAEAYRQLNKMSGKTEFEGAWVYKKAEV